MKRRHDGNANTGTGTLIAGCVMLLVVAVLGIWHERAQQAPLVDAQVAAEKAIKLLEEAL